MTLRSHLCLAVAVKAALLASPVYAENDNCTVSCIRDVCRKTCIEWTDPAVPRGGVIIIEERRKIDLELLLDQKKIAPGSDADSKLSGPSQPPEL